MFCFFISCYLHCLLFLVFFSVILVWWFSVIFTQFPLFFCLFVCLFFRAAPAAHGDSQAGGQIRATAASLHCSHSNSGSKPCLRPTYHSSWQCQILNPLSEARDPTHNVMVTSWICFTAPQREFCSLFLCFMSLLYSFV